jgi:putative membrane protein
MPRNNEDLPDATTATDPIEQAEYRGETQIVRGIVGGTLMGLANLVPGISGGTMLLATGVYPQFINGIAELSTFRFRAKTILQLACIAGAALAAIVLLAGTVSGLVVDHRWAMYSIFIGLTLGGVPVIWRMVRPADSLVVVMSIVGIAVMASMTFITPGGGGSADGSHQYIALFLAGLAGASAMVLPGVSGGYLLLVLGQYVTILAAIDMLKEGAQHGDWNQAAQSLHVIIPVGLGVIIGIVGVSNLIKILLAKYERATLGLLLGLLLGAVIGIWPFQQGVPPEIGAAFRGDTVAEIDGQLVGETTGRPIEAKDFATEFFTPTLGQVFGAIGLIAVGFAVSAGVARLGGNGERAEKRRS